MIEVVSSSVSDRRIKSDVGYNVQLNWKCESILAVYIAVFKLSRYTLFFFYENWSAKRSMHLRRFKVGLSHSKKNFFTCFKKPSKNDEKCFLFRLKNSFRSQDISVFVLNFSSDRKNGLIRKIKLVSKSMTSQLG